MKKRLKELEEIWQEVIPPQYLQFCMTSVEPIPGKKNTLDVVCMNCRVILN